MKILIASQDQFEARGIQWLLESSIRDIQVEVAHHAGEAIITLENKSPNLLILEMSMGQEEEAEKLFSTIRIIKPVIFSLTAEATFEAAKKAIDIGSRGLLAKPYLPQDLVQKVLALVKEIREKKGSKEQDPLIKSPMIEYNSLFLPSYKDPAQCVLAIIQPENASEISTLFQVTQEYPFPVRPKLYPLSSKLICLFEWKEEAQWPDIFKRFLLDWGNHSSENLSVFINVDIQSGKSVHQRYLDTNKTAKLTFFTGYSQVHTISEPIDWEFIDPFLTPSEQKFWIQSLNDGNKEEIQAFLFKEFLRFSSPYPDPELLRIRLTSILAQIRRYMKTFKLQENQHEKEYLRIFDAILKETVIYRIVQRLFIFITNIIDAVHTETNQLQHLDIIERCLHFIDLNYWNKQLDLQAVSDYVKRNASYISHLFTEKRNTTFRDTLNSVRVEHAKKHLFESDMSIKEIAAITGFQNQQYFSKIFYKWTGQTPTQYRSSGLKTK
ncbi:AraC family transcriptional regulator [Heyndrickxia acidicola]|uniref:Helix-turn-helix domain-containing protein n=1 Tax=Heyndrickxia acidicola TaxID=209389 RepID=A0ABU6MAT2_9BACI|nr:helix-turn-helix domain-containing protein [Heyndrickxia acidicola]MED1201736.1 helix-turn-helix domain-containing protein [Heyndrickxia acidicola]